MDRSSAAGFEYLALHEQRSAVSTILATSIAFLYLLYQILLYFDVRILSPQELLWNALVFILPGRVLLDAGKRLELNTNSLLSQTHAAKGEALRRMLGIGGATLMQNLPGAGVIRRTSILSTAKEPNTDAPSGLGNWDNSCYQNSVLQGLASLTSLKSYLDQTSTPSEHGQDSTSASLNDVIEKLNDPNNNGRQLWTPPKLKSMSSWQQQDAQEYFSKVMDELDKEIASFPLGATTASGLEAAVEEEPSVTGKLSSPNTNNTFLSPVPRNPMEGLLAQRVACTQCEHSEGLSLIPFNCLTVSLGSDFAYDIEECLDGYTKLEEIPEVECSKCTLLRARQQLQQLIPAKPSTVTPDVASGVDAKIFSLPPEVRRQIAMRLKAIHEALEDEDFAEKTLNETCQIPKKAHVSSTKTRQAVIGRAPSSLVMHVNRSVFDEINGVQRKNFANVRYPMALNLGKWMLDNSKNSRESGMEQMDPSKSMILGNVDDPAYQYRLQAVVTHHGRHENGHYIAYRKHPAGSRSHCEDCNAASDTNSPSGSSTTSDTTAPKWWRLSDENVSSVSEEDVLDQGGVFMLFYERENAVQKKNTTEELVAAVDVSELPTSPLVESETGAGILTPTETTVDVNPDPLSNFASTTMLPTPPQSTFDDSESLMEAPLTTARTDDDPDSSEQRRRYSLEVETSKLLQRLPTQPLMRTAHGRQASRQGPMSDGGFQNAIRPMATT